MLIPFSGNYRGVFMAPVSSEPPGVGNSLPLQLSGCIHCEIGQDHIGTRSFD